MDFFIILDMKHLKKEIKKILNKKCIYEILFLLFSVVVFIISTIYINFDTYFIVLSFFFTTNYFVRITDYNFIDCEVDDKFIRINYFNWWGDLKQAVFPRSSKIVIVKDKQFLKKRHFIRVDKEDGFQVFDILDENSLKTIPEQFLKT